MARPRTQRTSLSRSSCASNFEDTEPRQADSNGEIPAEADGPPAFNIYDEADLHAAIRQLSGSTSDSGFVWNDNLDHLSGEETIRLRRLKRIATDPRGNTRKLIPADHAMIEKIAALRNVIPHLGDLLSLVARCAHLSLMSSTPLEIPPVLLLGKPGCGKTYALKRLAQALGLESALIPCAMFDNFRFRGQSIAWRGARCGRIAEVLLEGATANPLIIADEFDKPPAASSLDRPFDAWLDLLEAENAARYRDDYLEFTFRADAISWIATANDVASIPAPVLDRLTVMEVPTPTPDQQAAIVASVYREVCSPYGETFASKLRNGVLCSFVGHSARNTHRLLECALGFAAAEGRRDITEADVCHASAITQRAARQIGFT